MIHISKTMTIKVGDVVTMHKDIIPTGWKTDKMIIVKVAK